MTQQSLIHRLKAVEEALAVALPASKWSADVEFHNATLSDLRELIKEAEGQEVAFFVNKESGLPHDPKRVGNLNNWLELWHPLYTSLGEKS